MVKFEEIKQLINKRLNKILLVAQSSMGETQFNAFRKIALDEFGNNGFVGDLKKCFGMEKGSENSIQERGLTLSGKARKVTSYNNS